MLWSFVPGLVRRFTTPNPLAFPGFGAYVMGRERRRDLVMHLLRPSLVSNALRLQVAHVPILAKSGSTHQSGSVASSHSVLNDLGLLLSASWKAFALGQELEQTLRNVEVPPFFAVTVV